MFCCWYYAKKHWLANNVLGICFSVEGIEHLSLGSVQTGAILLSGLFFYDIFWVFCTPVMVWALPKCSGKFCNMWKVQPASSYDAVWTILMLSVLSRKDSGSILVGDCGKVIRRPDQAAVSKGRKSG